MRLSELIIDGIIVYVAFKGIKLYGNIKEQKGVLEGAIAQASYDRAMIEKGEYKL